MDQTIQNTAQTNSKTNTPLQGEIPPAQAGIQVANVAGHPKADKKIWLWIVLAAIVIGAGVVAYLLL